ncbi:MAG TPA: glycosyltransferase family 4 protein [Steroidobacteraceae bacterium]|jgi:glycosyltransferase involved in cell wall biosynthesis|nr:glycosyltransferase family 4 protein [Steroidobacteraceae bacterium]
MDILFCNYEYPPLGGGGGVVMAALARELARRHSVTVLTSGSGALPRESVEQDVRVLRVPVFARRQRAVANNLSMLAYLPMGAVRGWRLRRASFDVVNTHFVVPSGPLGGWLAARLDVPNVLTVHGGDLYDPSKRSSPHLHWWLRAPIRALLRRADRVVGQSRDTLSRVQSIYGVQRRVELIPLGIERPPRSEPMPRASFGLPQDAFVLVTVGRLVARKAVEQLLKMLAGCERPDVHLLVIGEGPQGEALRAQADALGLQQRVHWMGQADEQRKFQALAAADIFVSTSQHEGFGLVFLEAMACGLPVICYDRGGQTDFLRSGETGMLVALNDLESFTRALHQLHGDAQLRQRMAQSNRERVEAYLIDRCAQQYEALFEDAIDQHARRPQRRPASLGAR